MGLGLPQGVRPGREAQSYGRSSTQPGHFQPGQAEAGDHLGPMAMTTPECKSKPTLLGSHTWAAARQDAPSPSPGQGKACPCCPLQMALGQPLAVLSVSQDPAWQCPSTREPQRTKLQGRNYPASTKVRWVTAANPSQKDLARSVQVLVLGFREERIPAGKAIANTAST